MLFHWLLIVGVLGFFVQSLVYRWMAFRGISYSRSFSRQRFFVGEQLEMIETVANRKWLPVPSFVVESTMPAFLTLRSRDEHLLVNAGRTVQNHRSLFALPSYTEIVRTHAIVCTGRGVYRMRSVALSAGGVTGLAGMTQTFELEGEVIAYPELIAVPKLPVAAKSWLESELSTPHSFAENHYLTAGVRPYAPRDGMRKVDWRATARTGTLLARKQETVVDPLVWLCVNVEDREGMWNAVNDTEWIEHVIRVAATLAVTLSDNGHEVGFACNAAPADSGERSSVIPPAGGRRHAESVLEALARLDLSDSMAFHELLGSIGRLRRGRLVIVAAVLDRKTEAQLARFQREGLIVDRLVLPKPRRDGK